MANKKLVIGTIGALLVIAGFLGTIPLSINRYLPGLVITGLMIVAGIITIAWVFSD